MLPTTADRVLSLRLLFHSGNLFGGDVEAIRRERGGLGVGAGEPNEYDYVLDWMEERLKFYFEIPTLGKFKVAGTRHDTILQPTHPEVERARAFGRSLGA